MMKFKVKKLSNNARLPTKNKEDVGWDLYISRVNSKKEFVEIGFGIAVEPPEGYYFELVPRSSMRNYKFVLSNSIGIIDPSYRGELMASIVPVGAVMDIVLNDELVRQPIVSFHSTYQIPEVGEKFCQLILRKFEESELEEVNDLSETLRGEGGHGSTGK